MLVNAAAKLQISKHRLVLTATILLVLVLFALQLFFSHLATQSRAEACECEASPSHVFVLMEQSRLSATAPGTEHWYHFLERLVANLDRAVDGLWTRGDAVRTVFIAFQEPASALRLSSFSALLLAAVMTGGRFKSVRIGHTRKDTDLWEDTWRRQQGVLRHSGTSVESGNRSAILFQFHETFALHEKVDSYGFTESAKNKRTEKRNLCVHPNHLYAGLLRSTKEKETYYWFWGKQKTEAKSSNPIILPFSSTNILRKLDGSKNISLCPIESTFCAFRQSVSRLCGLELDGSYLENVEGKKNIHINRENNNKIKILIYQRDSSRQLLNANVVLSRFHSKLSKQLVVNMEKHEKTEEMLQLLMHSEKRSACDLIGTLSQTIVFVTPHGFQSLLLLFQPLRSILVEVFPNGYLKQGFYGGMQAGLRDRWSIARQYLYEESPPDPVIWGGIIWLFKKYFGQTLCVQKYARPLCRYLDRFQSVIMSDNLINETIATYQQLLLI